MKKIFLLAGIFTLMSSVALNAQVTIGKDQQPNANAVLELVSQNNDKGFLPPRIALVRPHSPAPLSAHVKGMVVYNTTVVKDSLQEGLYTNNGTQWVAVKEENQLTPTWFYMPSFPINVSKPDDFTINLWDEYQRQFDHTVAGTKIIASDAGAPRPLPKVHKANELHYYVTGYDDTVFSNVQLSTTGVLSYSISTANFVNVSDSTYMNIVLVVK